MTFTARHYTEVAYIIATAGDHWERDPEAKRLTVAEGKRKLAEEARRKLLETLNPGDTVQCVLRHVSRSGMYRVIDFYKAEDSELVYLSGYIKNLGIGDEPRSGNGDGVGVGGCGMDMGFPWSTTSAKRSGPKARRSPTARATASRIPLAGYALKHRWI